LRNSGILLRAVDQRASVLDASNLLEDAALDRYEFIRDGYLQRRASKVLDTDKAQERSEKVQGQIDKVQEKVTERLEKLGVKKPETPGVATPGQEGDAPADAAPAAGSAPNNPPVPAPVSSGAATK
jgi:phospholipid-binding lipoprotein MlaA